MSAPLLVIALVGALVALGLVAGLYSARFGLSHLLVFLVVGMAAGVDGPLGLPFAEHGLAFAVGNLALAIILLDGGLRTPVATLRSAWAPAGLLATVGVVLCGVVVMGAAMLVYGMDWRQGALLGAVVSSTDAAAVFSQLSSSRVRLPPRVAAAIEIESGLNDPTAVLLTLAMIGVLMPSAATLPLGELLLRQVGLGVLGGIGAGLLMSLLLRALPLSQDHEGLTALLLAAAGAVVYALTTMAEGSGLLAIYLFGMVVAHRVGARVRPALLALNGYSWLAQALMFLLLGLLVTPHELVNRALPSLAIAATLMLVARPLAAWLCLRPLGFSTREAGFVGWVGLRGGVPIVLALYPVLAGVPQADLYFDTAFVVVLCSLLVQAPTLAPLARRLRLGAPAPRPHRLLLSYVGQRRSRDAGTDTRPH